MISAAIRRLLNLVARGLGSLLVVLRPVRQPGKLLLLRTDSIGDFVLFTPALRSYRKLYSRYHITLLVRDEVYPLTVRCPYVDSTITFSHRRYRRSPLYRLRTLYAIYKAGYEVAINTVFSRDSVCDEMILWTAARERVGWDTSAPNMSCRLKRLGDSAYTRLYRSSLAKYSHEIDRNKELLYRLGCPIVDGEVELWPVANDGMQYIEKLWQEYQLNGKNVVAVIIGSALDLKKWGIENYAKVIAKTRNLLKNPAFLIIGNLSDSQEAAALVSKVEGDIINLCGRTNLTDLPWIFDKVALAIGNDTGPMHIAISRGTPTVCILGGGQFGRFMPYGDPRQHKFVYHKLHCYFCDWNCVYPKAYCVHEISVDSVFNEIKALLAARQSHPILNVSNS